jgi:hypothetical protein
MENEKKNFQSCVKAGYSQRLYSKVNKQNKLYVSKTAVCDAETQYRLGAMLQSEVSPKVVRSLNFFLST